MWQTPSNIDTALLWLVLLWSCYQHLRIPVVYLHIFFSIRILQCQWDNDMITHTHITYIYIYIYIYILYIYIYMIAKCQEIKPSGIYIGIINLGPINYNKTWHNVKHGPTILGMYCSCIADIFHHISYHHLPCLLHWKSQLSWNC